MLLCGAIRAKDNGQVTSVWWVRIGGLRVAENQCFCIAQFERCSDWKQLSLMA